MLSEFEQAVLKNNRINEDDVASVDTNIVESYSRVMGYYRSMSEYNVGKRQEHEDRQYFQQPASAGECSCK